MKIVYPLQVVLIFLIPFLICYAERPLRDRFGGCYTEKSICSVKKNNKPVKLIKTDNAEFKRCPDTTHMCMEGGSEVFVNGTSAIYIEEYGTLNIFDGGSLSVFDNGICRIVEGSHLKIRPNGTLAINGAGLRISSYSVFENGGLISFDVGSKILISDSRMIIYNPFYSPSPPDSFIVGPESFVVVAYSSVINIGQSTQMITIANNNVRIENHSELRLYNSSVIMHNSSELSVQYNSALEVQSYVCGYKNKKELILGNNSKIKIYGESAIKLSAGKIVLKDDAELRVTFNGQLDVYGILEIESKFLFLISSEQVRIGQYNENCDQDASLVVTKTLSIPKNGLSVNKGAHCFTKAKDGHFDENAAKVELNGNSETNQFKCFNTRNALLVALGRSADTTF